MSLIELTIIIFISLGILDKEKIGKYFSLFNRTNSDQVRKVSKRVNIDTLKQRLYEEKKKEKVKRTIILSSVIVSLGALTMLTY